VKSPLAVEICAARLPAPIMAIASAENRLARRVISTFYCVGG
jgi:hypothetical protein